MSLAYSPLEESYPQVASVPPGGMKAPPPRANNGWYTPPGKVGSCVYLRQDGLGMQNRLLEDGGLLVGARHRGGGGLRPGNNHPSGDYVLCSPNGVEDVQSFCIPRQPRDPFDPKPSNIFK
jgi:hypothetical protein